MRTLLLLAVSACLSPAAENRPADEKAVREAVDQFNVAAKSGDAATLDKLLHADLIYGHSSALMEDKATCIKALLAGKPNFVLQPGATVQLYGKTAVVHGKMIANVVQNGKPVQIPLDYVQVWVKEGKAWRMTTRHTTRLPQS